MHKDSLILIAGLSGMVGSAMFRTLVSAGYDRIYLSEIPEDLRDQQAVNDFFQDNPVDVVINCAAVVGGIMANKNEPYKFIRDNTLIQTNLIDAAVRNNVKTFVFLGSTCVYPRDCEQPIKEDMLMTGPLEPTNEAYAMAKLNGMMMMKKVREMYGWKYISVMPTNLYGQGDNYNPKTSHVVPALIKRYYEAKLNNLPFVENMGTGTPMREFLYVDDLAEAILVLLKHNLSKDVYNVGHNELVTIKTLSTKVAKAVGYKGNTIWDDSYPDGTPIKCTDGSKLKGMGWKPNYSLNEGLELAFKHYLKKLWHTQQ